MARHQRLLVTGGAGFIGSHLVDTLLGDGLQVVCLDDFNDFYDPQDKRRNVEPHRKTDGYQLIEADIRDRDRVFAIVDEARPDVVVHLAARAGVRPSVEDPFLYETTNVAGTLNLLEACRRYAVRRFVFGSSSSIYGTNTKVPFAEDDPVPEQVSPYAATKLAGEALCNTYAHLYDLSITSLRFFTVYGPRQRPDLAIRKFAERIRSGDPITLFGDGSSSRDYTYVDDIIRGLTAAIDHDHRGHEVFNLGNSTPTTLLDLVRILEDAVGHPAKIEWAPPQPGDVPRTYADITKARRLLAYEPSRDLRAGIRQQLAWLDSADGPR